MSESETDTVVYRVLPEQYEQALEVDGSRWYDDGDGRPVWKERRAWRLMRDHTRRVLSLLRAFSGDYNYAQERVA